jgi:hypothetical protein
MRSAKKRSPKSNRKSRRLRINLPGGPVGGTEYQPDDKTWSAFEETLGQQIPAPVRDRLEKIVEGYFIAQPYESSSPYLADVLASVAKIKKEAVGLRETLRNQHPTNKVVQRVIGRNCQIRNVKPGLDQLYMLNHALTSLINAGTQAQAYFPSQPSFEEGDAWESMVSGVRRLFREHGLHSGASQDSNKGRPSKFVLFIEALQTSFPEASLRRHYGISTQTLASHINRLERKKRDIKKQKLPR